MALYPNGLRTPPTKTANFGWRIHPITGKRTMHYGVDSVGHPSGLNYAPASGVVAFAGMNGTAGNEVTIRDNDGNLWLIMHHAPNSLRVRKGDRVTEGQAVGTTGTTGGSTGVHCHLGLQVNGQYVDPYVYIAARLGKSRPASTNSTPITAEQEALMAVPFDLIVDSDTKPKTAAYVVVGNNIENVGEKEWEALNLLKAALVENAENNVAPGNGKRLTAGQISDAANALQRAAQNGAKIAAKPRY